MKITVAATFVFACVGIAANNMRISKPGEIYVESRTSDLQGRIFLAYRDSVEQCKAFNAGDEGCIAQQFDRNYHWTILGDIDPAVGHPGTPGKLTR